VRVVRLLAVLEQYARPGARVLDFGSYFGNFSLAARRAGYQVDAVDAYRGAFSAAFEPFVTLMRAEDVNVLDVEDTGYDFAGVAPETYDAVMFLSAIEHVPHTPRGAFDAINRVLKGSGLLVLDTPNLGYVYNRRKFASGRSVHPPIEFQFESEAPFFGHHREYLPGEVRWMLERVGHDVLSLDMFN
jgi:SAM-dependent methyltransferase